MEKSIMEKWVNALRSGEYKQTKEVLHNDTGYCCLGVLCELMPDTQWTENQIAYNGQEGYGVKIHRKAQQDFTVLPHKVQDWAGMWSVMGKYSTLNNLARDNDQGKSFNEIADIIETNYKKL